MVEYLIEDLNGFCKRCDNFYNLRKFVKIDGNFEYCADIQLDLTKHNGRCQFYHLQEQDYKTNLITNKKKPIGEEHHLCFDSEDATELMIEKSNDFIDNYLITKCNWIKKSTDYKVIDCKEDGLPKD
jgi:hypothetical protein